MTPRGDAGGDGPPTPAAHGDSRASLLFLVTQWEGWSLWSLWSFGFKAPTVGKRLWAQRYRRAPTSGAPPAHRPPEHSPGAQGRPASSPSRGNPATGSLSDPRAASHSEALLTRLDGRVPLGSPPEPPRRPRGPGAAKAEVGLDQQEGMESTGPFLSLQASVGPEASTAPEEGWWLPRSISSGRQTRISQAERDRLEDRRRSGA